MKKIYACLIGEWVCLNDDPNCRLIAGEKHKHPDIWWEENAEIWSPLQREKHAEHSMYQLDYVKIIYKGERYRINPIFIQVVD